MADVVDRNFAQVAAKLSLLFATLILMASMGGGFLLLPLLIPAHIWAARKCGPIGRVGWSLLPGITVGMATWAVVYLAIGELKPAIWLIPSVGALGAVIAIARLTAAPAGSTQTKVA